MMEIVGFVAAILMGASLGLIGGGGSILTVPIMVYLFGIDPVLSTSYSLFVVGVTSLIGAYSHLKRGNIDLMSAIVFGLPSIASVYAVRKLLVPLIPDPFFSIADVTVSKSSFILALFSFLMVLAAWSMMRKTNNGPEDCKRKIKYNYSLIIAEGMFVGGVTGLVGAGGGFLIIPALVLLGGLCMKKAVGTSLLIIALKSLIGFTADLGPGIDLDLSFMMIFTGIAVIGIIAGTAISRYVSNEKLKPAFGWFVLIMGCYILGREIFLLPHYN